MCFAFCFAGAVPGAERNGGPPASSAVEPAAAVGPLAGIDLAFDLRLDRIERNEKRGAGFAFVEKEFRRAPRPHVRARYGEYLLAGEARGAPAGRAGEGMTLVREALHEGSLQALRIMGWELLAGQNIAPDSVRGLGCLLQATTLGNLEAMHALGEAQLRGLGMPVNLTEGEAWIRRVADLGNPHPLFGLAQSYEKRPDGSAHACQLYYEAAVRGSYEAKRHLDDLVLEKNPSRAALRAHKLVMLWLMTRGIDVERTLLRASLGYLEKEYGKDPEVLVALGRYHVATTNSALALTFFEKAMQLGSADGRAERACVLARTLTKGPPHILALAELRSLETDANAIALAALGAYHYWDSLADVGLKKDPALAFAYSKRAADRGSAEGQANVAFCYEFGIGTPVDLALAAFYYRAAAMKGDRRGQEKSRVLAALVE